MKQCRKCGVELVEGENWNASQVKLNYRVCKECHSAHVRHWYGIHREKIQERRRQRNLQRYKDGKAQIKWCKKCGVELDEGENWYPSQAKVGQRICKECQKTYSRRYGQEHREEQKEYRQVRRIENRIYHHEYQKNHRSKRRGYTHKRNALKAALPATLTDEEWQEILEKYNYCCAYCNCDNLLLEQEHKIPVSRGGGYTAENIVPACRPCNRHKGTQTYSEFLKSLKVLR